MFQSDVSVILATSYYLIKNTFFSLSLVWSCYLMLWKGGCASLSIHKAAGEDYQHCGSGNLMKDRTPKNLIRPELDGLAPPPGVYKANSSSKWHHQDKMAVLVLAYFCRGSHLYLGHWLHFVAPCQQLHLSWSGLTGLASVPTMIQSEKGVKQLNVVYQASWKSSWCFYSLKLFAKNQRFSFIQECEPGSVARSPTGFCSGSHSGTVNGPGTSIPVLLAVHISSDGSQQSLHTFDQTYFFKQLLFAPQSHINKRQQGFFGIKHHLNLAHLLRSKCC